MTFKTLTTLSLILPTFIMGTAHAQMDMADKPVLTITNKPMVATNSAPIYSRPSRVREITPQEIAKEIMADPYIEQGSTVVGKRIETLNKDLLSLQSTINRLSEQLSNIETRDESMAATYYANVATINAQLQSGTTPGNPRLVKKLDIAQNALDSLAGNTANLNALAVEISDATSRSTYLLDTIRSTYNLSGAIEEDHARLAQLEDQVNNSSVSVNRLLNDINDGITRATAYMAGERNNLRTLSLGVTSGRLYGGSLDGINLSNISPASAAAPTMPAATQPAIMQKASFGGNSESNMPSPLPTHQRISAPVKAVSMEAIPDNNPKPLAKIRFDKPDVDYKQPVYNAVQNALQRFPNGRFEILAVHPTAGNAAKVAIESTRARRNAEDVLRNLTQMGIAMERIDIATAADTNARTNEVHIFVK